MTVITIVREKFIGGLGYQMVEGEYDIPVWLECPIHEGYDPRAYYTDGAIANMIDGGSIDCPLCLEDICDHGG
jgi:hypothetical protein